MSTDNECIRGKFTLRGSKAYTLDNTNNYRTMSVYCSCGSIVVLDRSEMRLRLSLGKELECPACRNVRIGQEIDLLNSHFDGLDEVEESAY